jgi:hypothetical protein
MVANNSEARLLIHDIIFPDSAVVGPNSDELAPEDCPSGTFRYFLTRLMTSTDLTLKRLTAEFLYEVCSQDSEYRLL